MLSNVDIENEIGKNIYIYPFNRSNIRGSSINLSASNLAWSLTGGDIKEEKYRDYVLVSNSETISEEGIKVEPKTSLLFKKPNCQEIIIIPPQDTALIETEEVISISNKIGGTYHSKVGSVSRGSGHIGTTLDPGFTGQSLIAVHNHTSEPIEIEVGSTFVSLVLSYLTTKSTYSNTNYHGHVGLLTKIGILLSDEENSILEEEWKKNRKLVGDKLISSKEYKDFIEKREEEKKKHKFFNRKFIKIVCVPIIVIFVMLLLFPYGFDKFVARDNELPTFKWVRDIALSGGMIAIMGIIYNLLYKKFEKENE